MLANPHPQSTEAFQRSARAIKEHDTLDRLGAIDAPTLVIAGEIDWCLPPRFSRQLAAGIPGARLVEAAGRAHQPFQEAPEEFDALVERVLALGALTRDGRPPRAARCGGDGRPPARSVRTSRRRPARCRARRRSRCRGAR